MLWIHICLAIFGIGATLSAFGGETWVKGEEKLISRVTHRGWFSLTFLLAAFALGVTKEVIVHNEAESIALKNKKLQSENQQQRDRIEELVSETVHLQEILNKSANDLDEVAGNLGETTEQIGQQQLASIEAAFALAIKSPRETDDAVVHLRGQRETLIPSRHYDHMQLYWGDQFHFVVMSYGASNEQLATLKLQVGPQTYPLHDGSGSGFFEKTLRIYGDSPNPMTAAILNPLGLRDVDLKIFVRTTDSSQGQNEFRRIVLNSPFSEFAKKIYKVTKADILNVRANPDTSAEVKSRLAMGSFVRSLQSVDQWTEVMTPEGRQGWVATKYLAEIE